MTKKFLLMALVLLSALAVGVVAYAQEDDDAVDDDATDDDAADDDAGGFDASTVIFTAPTALEPNSPYTFEFDVFNAAPQGEEKGIWIRQVDMTLPEDYVLAEDADQPAPPDCLNPGPDCDHWEVTFDSQTNKITWQSFGQVSTVNFGDIREQDTQTFSFIATTDEGPTNLFEWVLTGDDGSFVEGESSIGTTDDDSVDDDAADDDDDDDSGGCGC